VNTMDQQPASPDSSPPSRGTEDVARAQVVVDDLAQRGIPCEVEDVFFAHSLMGHVRALLHADPSAANKSSVRLSDYGSSLGMTASVILGKLVRELRAAENEAEQIALTAVAIVTVLGCLTFRQSKSKFDRPRKRSRSSARSKPA